MSELSVSVVVSAWSEARLPMLEKCLAAILSQTLPAAEVIVAVDNNPALLEAIEQHWPTVRVVATENGRGAANSRNTGTSHARAAYVAFLDDDAYPASDWLERMGAALADGDVVGVGGQLNPAWPSAGRPWWFPPEFDWVVGCSYVGLPTERTPVRNVISANMAIRRDELVAIGGERAGSGRVGLNPANPCEETELCIRLGRRYPESTILFDPDMRATHHVTVERTRWAYFVRRCIAEGQGKALLARLVGRQTGLASERQYATRTLPAGVVRNLRQALAERSLRPVARAGVIVIGLALTGYGYVTAGVTQRKPASSES